MLVNYTFAGGTANEIAAGIEAAVAAGTLLPGVTLPPVRELAGRTGVNANTAAAAYRLLRERGVVETAGRRGTRVRPRPASTAREDIRIYVPQGVRDLSQGNPDPALLPDLSSALAAAARDHAVHPALYGTGDDPELLTLAAAALQADGVPGPMTAVWADDPTAVIPGAEGGPDSTAGERADGVVGPTAVIPGAEGRPDSTAGAQADRVVGSTAVIPGADGVPASKTAAVPGADSVPASRAVAVQRVDGIPASEAVAVQRVDGVAVSEAAAVPGAEAAGATRADRVTGSGGVEAGSSAVALDSGSGSLAVTSGTLDAVERVLLMHLRPGDAVAVEDPGWSALLDLVAALGLRPIPMTLDDDGPLPADLERALGSGARGVIITARAQNPTGAAVSATRARELRALLAAHPHVLLIEDDHAAGLADLPLNTLTGTTAHWILTRSTAKSHGPDLRLAVVTGDPQTVDRLRGRQRLAAGWVSHLLQRTVAHLWRTGAVPIQQVAASYAARRNSLITALAEHGIESHGRSGLNVWIPVHDETAAITRLLDLGWAAAPGARNRIASPPAIRVTIAPLSLPEIPPLATAIATAVRPAARGRFG